MESKGSLGKRVLGAYSPRSIQKLTTTFRRETWRYTGPFTRWNRFKGAFPGLGIATVAFAGYLVYEAIFLRKPHGHAEGHSEEHH
jgi:NADH dehydrogenase (ubiquinone) 1 beta subcomplex subunit 3